MFSLREFSFLYYLLKYKQIPSPKPFLSRRNIMYPFTENWFLGKKLSIFVYDVPSIKFFVVSNCSFWKNLCLDDLAFFRIIQTEVFEFHVWVPWFIIVSFDVLLHMSSKIVFLIIRGYVRVHCIFLKILFFFNIV